MKNIKLYFFFSVIALLLYSCEEDCNCINFSDPIKDTSLVDTTYITTTFATPQMKMILIEDFTGVKCPNCPNAAQKIEDMQALYPGRILAAAIHFKNVFGTPHSGSKDDFRTEAGLSIYNMLPGQHGVLPIGDVDRTRHTDGNGNFSVLQMYPSWTTYVNEQLTKNTSVNINITNSVIDTTCNVMVKLQYTQATSDTQALTIYLVEDSIIDLQTLPTTAIDSDYVHKHVIRAVLTNYDGDNLTSSLVLNRVFEKEYKITLNPKWVKKNCSIIAFVHKKGYYFDIIHAQQKHLL